ncbi:hypothetical protein EDM56_01920 [Brevibacillus fluminis]|uniref:Uncharacterized protein n=1 Tax=Brevibacillus fluminis TaxID=511487 RepID=A0A3M8DY56_9BACL|nr:hypothetical protein [Brevibacillus fluminis]RNB92475.1 hypothetical protein EDM56_01920 [Brevibacillus fluminis]
MDETPMIGEQKWSVAFPVVVAKQKKKPSETQGNCLSLVGFGVNLYGDDSILFSLGTFTVS